MLKSRLRLVELADAKEPDLMFREFTKRRNTVVVAPFPQATTPVEMDWLVRPSGAACRPRPVQGSLTPLKGALGGLACV